MTNEEFWKIVKSEEFKTRFYGEHPLYAANGGQDFYNVENLKSLRHHYRKKQLKHPAGRNQYVYRNTVKVVSSWLKQVEWIELYKWSG